MLNSSICVYGLYLGDRSQYICGIGHKPLQDLVGGELSAVFEPEFELEKLQNADSETALKLALAYSEIQIQIFAEVRSMLPWSLRSAFFPTLELFQTFLSQQHTNFSQRLSQLQNCAEISLTGKFSAPHPPTQLEGRAYFLAKKQAFAQQQQRHQQAQAIVELMQPQQVIWQAPRPPEQFRVTLLVNLSELQTRQAQIQQWQIDHPGWELDLSAPLPPYSFI